MKTKKTTSSVPLMSRRTLVRGLPAGLAGLSIMTPFWDRLIRRAVAQTVSQQRLLVWYVPDGLVPEWFWPAQAGALNIRSDRTNDLSGTTFNTAISAADAATFMLQPISAYSARTLMVKGINNPGAADHTYSTQSCLTGDAVKQGAAGTSVSLDVLMSEANLTQNHALPVFRTGVYGSRTSYTGATEPSPVICTNDGQSVRSFVAMNSTSAAPRSFTRDCQAPAKCGFAASIPTWAAATGTAG